MELQVRKTENIVRLRATLGDIENYFCDGFQIGNKLYYSLNELWEYHPSVVCGHALTGDTIFLEIDIDTGEVTNWPKNCPVDFHDIKIVDTGNYWLVNDYEETVISYSGYVPSCLGEGGYGDYLEFEIDKNSHIIGWSFDQKDCDEFEENT